MVKSFARVFDQELDLLSRSTKKVKAKEVSLVETKVQEKEKEDASMDLGSEIKERASFKEKLLQPVENVEVLPEFLQEFIDLDYLKELQFQEEV